MRERGREREREKDGERIVTKREQWVRRKRVKGRTMRESRKWERGKNKKMRVF